MNSIHRVPCDHADQPHTVYVGVEDGGPPVPIAHKFDNQEDALEFAGAINRTRVWLIKVFRSDNESYTCYRWAPDPEEPAPDTITVHGGDWAALERHYRMRTFAWLFVIFLLLALAIGGMLVAMEGSW